ncbi:DUF6233 domain-containing protein [Streptomyces sp. NBC_00873]|uniref:DUF6233 domain-containing protein n=1 Tax=unclassified Streptomyces TaxID=2593676 RepID=UPI00386DA1F4|nr:DUF6233 domain-containing protein [Streptomyces sp. NBC_00873]WTA46526.1 DUF6233 domain-containing protein [Streptomyces sp. NBC_00842]
MYDLPPDLPRLRTLETFLVMLLARVRQRIGEVEQRERGKQRGGEQRGQGKRQPTERPSEEQRPRPHTPDWGITDTGIGVSRAEVHHGDCWAGRQLRAVSREEAAAARAEGTPACEVCRPDTVLGRQE